MVVVQLHPQQADVAALDAACADLAAALAASVATGTVPAHSLFFQVRRLTERERERQTDRQTHKHVHTDTHVHRCEHTVRR
jgi:hypothetical protein